MKQIYLIYSILLLSIVGCTSESTCQNITIEKNITVEVIKEVNITQPPIIINNTVEVPDIECNKQRLKLITQLDYYSDSLDDCLRSNSTELNDDLEENLSDCIDDLDDLNDTMHDWIDDLNDTINHLRLRLNESNVSE